MGKKPVERPRIMFRRMIFRVDLADAQMERMKWIQLVEIRDQWRAFVNMALNFLVLYAIGLIS